MCAVQMRFVRATASVTIPRRLSMTTKSLPPPAIFEKRNGLAIGIFAAGAGLNPPSVFSHATLVRARTSKFDGAFRVIRSAIATLLVAATAAAQQPQQNQSNEPLPKLTETIDVRVINVDVVVTDKKGNAITGLKPEDFELYENGVPKKITNFYEVEGS